MEPPDHTRLRRLVLKAFTRHAAAHGIAWVDIFDISERAAGDRSLVARDGLHPSGAQYALWVERILPVVATRIGRH